MLARHRLMLPARLLQAVAHSDSGWLPTDGGRAPSGWRPRWAWLPSSPFGSCACLPPQHKHLSTYYTPCSLKGPRDNRTSIPFDFSTRRVPPQHPGRRSRCQHRVLLGVAGKSPKDRTARFATFLSTALRLNLVLVVNDSGQPLDTYSLYHLGLGLLDRESVIESYHNALAQGWEVIKPPRTTWHGTPLHELWLRDPTGYQIELYARLTPDELAQMPQDKRAVFLVSGTGAVI